LSLKSFNYVVKNRGFDDGWTLRKNLLGGIIRYLNNTKCIMYILLQVKLYTKQGSLKYQTDCAPNNGYYMVPVYDRGEYILKVEPPPGWTFGMYDCAYVHNLCINLLVCL